jgi:hypothetical protein
LRGFGARAPPPARRWLGRRYLRGFFTSAFQRFEVNIFNGFFLSTGHGGLLYKE